MGMRRWPIFRSPLALVVSRAIVLLWVGSLERQSQAADGRAEAKGAALSLDGSSGYMFAQMVGLDPFTTEATLSAWVFLDELPSQTGRIFHICGKSGFARDLDLHVEPDDRFHFYVARGAPNTVESETVVQPGRWYRVAATYRADDEIAIYVDGAREASHGIPGIQRMPNVGPLSVGENIAFPGRKFRGQIDEVSFWSRALSSKEIAALWRAPSRRQPGLRAAFPFDGDAKDHSSNGFDGQLVGGVRYVRPGAPRTPSVARPVAPAADAGMAAEPPPPPRPQN
jgi:hypothetical protein